VTSIRSRPTSPAHKACPDAVRHLAPGLVEQAQVVTGHSDPGGADPDPARLVGQENVQHLGHAQAVDDVHAEMRRPPLVQGGRERLARRGGQPGPGQGIGRQPGAQHPGEEGWAGEKQCRGVRPGPFGHDLGACRSRLQYGRRPDGDRGPHASRQAEGQRILAEAGMDGAAMSFIAGYGQIGSQDMLVTQSWDLGALEQSYEDFIDEFTGLDPVTGEDALRAQTRLVHQWRRFPFLDPRLPARLLPDNWSGGPR
jgi:hypothetical protein